MAPASDDSLIGRARELERLRRYVDSVADGATAALLIEGEAGIGKTRLLMSLIETPRASGLAVLVFRPQLVRDAIYEEMPEAARIALHREAGRELARAGAPLSQVASHVLLGAVTGDAEAALSLRGAARDAAARAPGIAVALLRRADELLPPDHPERDGVLLELVVALLRTGQVAQAAKITEDVLARPHDADVDLPLRIGR